MNISMKGCTKIYEGGVYAVRDLELDVRSGEFLVIMGESGSGKSTLLKLLSGIEQMTLGEMYFDGIRSESIPAEKKSISLVFQEYVLYPHMTVYENIVAGSKYRGISYEEADRRANYAIELFGLNDAKDQKPRSLSGGQQQRTSLAKALVCKSRLVLMDEPMSNVSEQAREEYCRLLSRLKRELPDSTFIYVTHNIKEALALGDRVAFMERGRIVGCVKTRLLKRELYGDEPAGILRTEKYAPLFRLPVEESDGEIIISGNKISRENEIYSRLIREPEGCFAEICIEKLSKSPLPNGISLVLEVKDNDGDSVRFSISGVDFYMHRRTRLEAGMKVRMYYDIKDIMLYDGGGRISSRYSLGGNIFPAKQLLKNAKGSTLSGELSSADRAASDARIFVPYTAISSAEPAGQLSVKADCCLAEDDFGDFKICFFDVKGALGVVSARLPADFIPFPNKNIRLNIDPSSSLIIS